MFCPRCGTKQGDDLKFCKSCGFSLLAVRQAEAASETGGKFDWSKTWVAEMLLSESARKKQEEEIERQRGITPEIKRYNEIKNGVMTSCVGVGVMIFLFVIAQGIVAAGIPEAAAHILSSIWVAGMIPFFVGVALIVNGLIVSKKIVEATRRGIQLKEPAKLDSPQQSIRVIDSPSSDWPEPIASVTENTTRQLQDSRQTE
ncbi:MAG TPA: DUF6249 domain-containing protein [Blastocatellia bacterium]|nr:DUF6249 domain-containing protein [Blastocatellia bacterium]